MPDWLELELAEELRPVAAPDELWNRIRNLNPRPAARRESPRVKWAWASWPIAALITLMIAAVTLWLAAKGQGPVLDLRQLAIQQLREPQPLDLRSSDPAHINEWMNRQAGVELSLPTRSRAQLVGARVIQRGGARIGAVTYRVGDDTATLLIARAGTSADFGHGSLLWQARGQTYALASSNPDHPEAACLLCHASL
ncbi:MAG: hypothetical protein LAQ69_02065 [Acidobacteriia bacterium]|nr:hypothetical protein [Terriglobia bacterium]